MSETVGKIFGFISWIGIIVLLVGILGWFASFALNGLEQFSYAAMVWGAGFGGIYLATISNVLRESCGGTYRILNLAVYVIFFPILGLILICFPIFNPLIEGDNVTAAADILYFFILLGIFVDLAFVSWMIADGKAKPTSQFKDPKAITQVAPSDAAAAIFVLSIHFSAIIVAIISFIAPTSDPLGGPANLVLCSIFLGLPKFFGLVHLFGN